MCDAKLFVDPESVAVKVLVVVVVVDHGDPVADLRRVGSLDF